jgi:hypothetical protein
MPFWKEAEQADEPQPDPDDITHRINRLRKRMEYDAQVCRNLEKNWIPALEEELAKLESVAAPPPARVDVDETTKVINTSVFIETIPDVGPASNVVVAGSIITTLEGEALEALKQKNPTRKVFQVSLRTIKERQAAGHAA